MPPVTVQLRPSGEGGPFRERLASAIAALAGEVGVSIVAVVVELSPVPDARPDATKLRRALKRMRRQHGLKAQWHVPPVRPKTKPKRARRKG